MSGGPLPVYFKLPISEISEIDDHKSVSNAGRDNLTRFSSNILNQIHRILCFINQCVLLPPNQRLNMELDLKSLFWLIYEGAFGQSR
jgi:hypothetical protein